MENEGNEDSRGMEEGGKERGRGGKMDVNRLKSV